MSALTRLERTKSQAKIRRIRKGGNFSAARESYDYGVGGAHLHASTPEGAVFLAELAEAGAFGEETRDAVRAI